MDDGFLLAKVVCFWQSLKDGFWQGLTEDFLLGVANGLWLGSDNGLLLSVMEDFDVSSVGFKTEAISTEF